MSRLLLVLLVVLCLGLSGCGGAPAGGSAQVEVTREVTRVVEVTVPVEVTRVVEVTVPVEVTRAVETVVTATPEPTATAVSEPPRVRLAGPVAIVRGGVAVTVTELVLTDWAVVRDLPELAAIAERDAFQDATVLGILGMTIHNATPAKVNIYADQGQLVLGSEQVALTDFMFFAEGDLGGEFFEGVITDGQIVFALRRTSWAEVAGGMTAILEITAPSDAQYNRLADEPYRFDLLLQPEE